MASGLATRCSACGTVFRVVPDQLRVSEGWVRCGRCSEVFNALEGLVDMDTGMPKHRASTRSAPRADEDAEDDFEIAHPAARPGAPPLPPAAQAAPPITPVSPPAPVPQRTYREPARPASGPARPDAEDTAPATEAPSAAGPAGATPSFVRSAERAARWRQPRVRAGLLGLALLGLLGLAGQVSLEYRDLLAASVPQSRPWLVQACAALGCTVEAARAIENLAVESSGLVRVEKSDLYRLQVSLRNRAGIDLAVPALDVTLTDTQGRQIARKVLLLAEMGVPQATIAAGRDLSVQATLQAAAGSDAASRPIAGYTIELFYP